MRRWPLAAMQRLRSTGTILCALAIALVAASAAATPAAAADAAVAIDDFSFTPLGLTIPVGTRVVWTNQQAGVSHTVTSDTGVWDSGPLAAGATFAYTFNQVGTFAYHSSTDPAMQGSVTVVATASALQIPTAASASPARYAPAAPTPVIPSGLPRTGGGGEAMHRQEPVNIFLGLVAVILMFVSVNIFVSKRARR